MVLSKYNQMEFEESDQLLIYFSNDFFHSGDFSQLLEQIDKIPCQHILVVFDIHIPPDFSGGIRETSLR